MFCYTKCGPCVLMSLILAPNFVGIEFFLSVAAVLISDSLNALVDFTNFFDLVSLELPASTRLMFLLILSLLKTSIHLIRCGPLLCPLSLLWRQIYCMVFTGIFSRSMKLHFHKYEVVETCSDNT